MLPAAIGGRWPGPGSAWPRGGAALAALLFVFWGRPTAAVVVLIVILLLIYLGLIELISRPPARPPGPVPEPVPPAGS